MLGLEGAWWGRHENCPASRSSRQVLGEESTQQGLSGGGASGQPEAEERCSRLGVIVKLFSASPVSG